MTSGELNALEVRGQALDQMCASGTSLSRDARVALCGTGGGIVVGSAAGGFHWSDFGFGAGAMLGLALLVSGLAAGAYYSRRGSFRSRPVP